MADKRKYRLAPAPNLAAADALMGIFGYARVFDAQDIAVYRSCGTPKAKKRRAKAGARAK